MAPPSRLDKFLPDQPDAAALQALPAECQEHVKNAHPILVSLPAPHQSPRLPSLFFQALRLPDFAGPASGRTSVSNTPTYLLCAGFRAAV